MRSFWRHEQMAVQMVLATVTHHSFDKVGTASDVLPNQKTATRTGKGKEYVTHHTAKIRKTPPPSGERPAALLEPRPQGQVQRHTVEHIIDVLPFVQILDVPVPQVGWSSCRGWTL